MSSSQLAPSDIIVANVFNLLSALQPLYDKLLTGRKVPNAAHHTPAYISAGAQQDRGAGRVHAVVRFRLGVVA
jgi:hypothetical protein